MKLLRVSPLFWLWPRYSMPDQLSFTHNLVSPFEYTRKHLPSEMLSIAERPCSGGMSSCYRSCNFCELYIHLFRWPMKLFNDFSLCCLSAMNIIITLSKFSLKRWIFSSLFAVSGDFRWILVKTFIAFPFFGLQAMNSFIAFSLTPDIKDPSRSKTPDTIWSISGVALV